MSRLMRFVGAVVCLVGISAALFAQENLAQTVSAQIAVADPAKAALSISTWAADHGGYFVNRSLNRISFRVAPRSLPSLRSELESVSFQVLSYAPSARDVSDELSIVEAGITSRNDAVEHIMKYLALADVSSTLAFEKELNGLVSEIEKLEGRRRYLLDSVALARVEVGLSSAARTVPVDVPSSFDWIKSLGLYDFLNSTGRGGRR